MSKGRPKGMPWDDDDIPPRTDRDVPPDLVLVPPDGSLAGGSRSKGEGPDLVLQLASQGNARNLPDWGRYLPNPIEWLFKDIIPMGSCVVLGAAPKAYKTWLTLDMAVALALKRSFLGLWPATFKGRTLLYSPEGASGTDPSLDAFSRRLWRVIWGEGLGRDGNPQEVGELPDLVRRYPGRLDLLDDGAYSDLAATVKEWRPNLLVLDPLITCYRAADENSAADMQPALDRIRDLLRLNPRCSIVVVHHYSKGGRDSKSFGTSLRGSGALAGWADGLLTISNPTGKPDGARKLEVWLRDGGSPDPVGFRLEDGDEVVNGVSAIRLVSCNSPTKRPAANKEPSPGRALVLNAVKQDPGKWTGNALANELKAKHGGGASTYREHCKALVEEEGLLEYRTCEKGRDKLWSVENC